MNEMKYIIFRKDEEEHSIVFPKDFIHKDFIDCHSASSFSIISAGFCSFGLLTKEVVCYGESESLKRKSRAIDSLIITKDFFGNM